MVIYKYTSVMRAISIVKSGKVVLNSPQKFNDPFDSTFCIDAENRRKAFGLLENSVLLKLFFSLFDSGKFKLPASQIALISSERNALLARLRKDPHYRPDAFFVRLVNAKLRKNEETKNIIERSYKEFCDAVTEKLKSAWSTSLVSCFSKRNDSILMWSHYADSHKGVCIEFESPCDPAFQEVRYSDRKVSFDLCQAMSLAIGCGFLNEKVKTDDPDLIRSALAPFYAKSKEWGYEQEVRCVYSSDTDRGKIDYEEPNYLLKMPEITKVYFGCRAGGEDLEHLERLLANRGVPMAFMKESESEFLIVPNEEGKCAPTPPKEEKEVTLLRILSDIRKSLDCNAYLSAFGLSLAVPSICAAVDFPELADERERYIKWIDTYHPCATRDSSDFGKNMACLSGEACYEVRNQLAGHGNLQIKEEYGSFKLKHITLLAEARKPFDLYVNEMGEEDVSINVRDFCNFMVSEAEMCYKKHKAEIDALPQIDVVDFDQQLEEMEECGIASERWNQKLRNFRTAEENKKLN